jgi:hypothetical protein
MTVRVYVKRALDAQPDHRRRTGPTLRSFTVELLSAGRFSP